MNWISVKDRLPKENKWVLGSDGSIYEVIYTHLDDDETKQYVNSDGKPIEITHWMELPELPSNNESNNDEIAFPKARRTYKMKVKINKKTRGKPMNYQTD